MQLYLVSRARDDVADDLAERLVVVRVDCFTHDNDVACRAESAAAREYPHRKALTEVHCICDVAAVVNRVEQLYGVALYIRYIGYIILIM